MLEVYLTAVKINGCLTKVRAGGVHHLAGVNMVPRLSGPGEYRDKTSAVTIRHNTYSSSKQQ